MVVLLLTAIIFSAPLAAAEADRRSDGGYVALELQQACAGASPR
jgi:hypothetical protein